MGLGDWIRRALGSAHQTSRDRSRRRFHAGPEPGKHRSQNSANTPQKRRYGSGGGATWTGPYSGGASSRHSQGLTGFQAYSKKRQNGSNRFRRFVRSFQQTVTAYHGTPTITNASDIIKHGFLVGAGNAYGDGIYMSTDINEAKRYGVFYLKCQVHLGRCCQWSSGIERQFNDWCRRTAARADNSAKTAFLLKQGYHSLRAGNVVVILLPQYANPTAHKVKLSRIRVQGVYRSDTDKRALGA